jgi:dTDP-glucose pyrophosphorylase
MIEWRNHVVTCNITIREAMIHLDRLAVVNADLFVVDANGRLEGSLSDGDIRRALIKGAEMSDSVSTAMNAQCISSYGELPAKQTLQECKSRGIRFLPLLKNDNTIINVIDTDQFADIIPVEAIIMAGGEGKRLRPLTEKIPKPLLPIGGKSIIEYNIDRLIKFGIKRIRISVNYLGQMIQDHLDGSFREADLTYIFEEKPLGTAGAISIVDNWHSENILIMNSDILTDINYSDFYSEFINLKADMAIAATPYTINVPYAVLETNNNNDVKSLAEKPSYTYYSNAGIYLLKRDLLNHIPANCFYDMPDLIQALMNAGHKVISYPIRGYWLDIGKMNDYLKAQEDIKHLKL